MTPSSTLTVRIAVFLLAFTGQLFADSPPLLTTGVEIGSSNEKTALNRATRNLSSTVDVKIKNTSDRLLEPPLHAVISFTPLNGGNLAGLTMPGTQGGIGVAPYQTFYKDLSASIGNGLAAGAETTFSFTFERPADTTVTYSVAIRGIRNTDPVASIGGPYSGQQGAPLVFNASASSDPDAEALTFAWDFGDGGTAGGSTPEHTFAASGIYTVTLIATDARGAAVSKETQVPISPSGVFALARTRALDGNGHPLGAVTITQSGPDGSRPFVSDSVSGFASLGGSPGDHSWSFERSGYLTSFRKSTLAQGQVKVVPFPWLTALNPDRTTLSLLDLTPVNSPSGRVTLTMPTGAFDQVQSVAITELHGQSLPLPLPFGWSPLAAFHLDMPVDSAVEIPASLKLLQPLATTQTAVLAWMDTTALAWKTESLIAGTSADTLAATLRKPGSYAVVIADTLPTGNPAIAQVGQPLPAGTAPTIDAEVTAIGQVNPAITVASLDPEKVTAQATVDFTNHTQPLTSGAWFLADVGETYDLRDGQLLKTPDYDATFYAYQNPGDTLAPTATAAFPLRPRLLYGPDQLTEAHIKVDVLSLNRFTGGIITPDGGKLSIPGVQVTVPPGAVRGPTAAEVRPLSPTKLAGFLGGFQSLLAFEINLPPLADGSALDLAITQKLTPGSNFVLARCVSSARESGLQPVLRLRSDAQGQLTSAEPATGPRLPGITGSGQYVIVQITDPAALVTGLVRKVGGALLPSALVRASGEPWLSLTGNTGTFFTLAKPGQRTLTGTDPADGNSGQATATLADAAATANVEIQTATTGPRVVSTTPAASAPRASNVAPVTVEFSEPIQPGSFGATGVRLHDVVANTDVAGSLSLDLTHRKATLLPLNPLAYATDYEIIVSNTLLDRQSLPIEGTLTFAFKTAPSSERPAGAQLVIYEPDARSVPPSILSQLVGYDPAAKLSMVVATGSPGTADPEVPVILVNDNTGETATVLSKPDGSFATFIEAAEEDFVSATFVNANGTRISVAATRQLYDDGRVGLYRSGGILEAQSDGGPVQVLIEPDAITSRSVFKVEIPSLAELLATLNNTQPDGGKLLGGLKLEFSGDPLSRPADVSFPVTPADLNVPPGEVPEHGVYALCEKVEIDGQVQYGIVDNMDYEDGRLVTHSPPFPGIVGATIGTFLYLPVQIAFGTHRTVVGRVVSAPQGVNVTEAMILNATAPLVPLPGVIVNVEVGGSADVSSRLRPGAFVARTNRAAFYAAIVPSDVTIAQPVLVRAFSPRLPGQVASSTFSATAIQNLSPGTIPVFTSNVIFRRPAGAGSDDTFAPLISTRTDSTVQPISQDVLVEIEARDDQTQPVIQALDYVPEESVPLVSGETLLASDVVLTQGSTLLNGTTLISPVTLLVRKAAIIVVRVKVADEAGNQRTALFKFRFGAAPPLTGDDPPASDFRDAQPPRVTAVAPASEAIVSDGRVVLFFSERVRHAEIEGANVLALNPSPGGSSPALIRLGPDGMSAAIDFSGLAPGTTYTATLSTGGVRDLKGNFMSNGYVWSFRTPAETAKALGGLSQAVASLVSGPLIVSIGRDDDGTLVTHFVGDTDNPNPIGKLGLPSFPRALVDIGPYSFKRSPAAGTPVETRHLVAVTGGLTGSDQVGPWLWVVDVSDPANPTRLASSLATADFASVVSSLRWDSPYLMLAVNTAERGLIYHVNLQAFILGSGGFHAQAYKRGADFNSDGDFVDPGDQLPVPERFTLFGLELPLPVEAGRTILDFDSDFGGRFLIAALGPKAGDKSRLAVLTYQGLSIGDGSGPEGVAQFIDPGIKRVMFDFSFPVRDASGARVLPVALTTSGDTVRFWDLSNPSVPTMLTAPAQGSPAGFKLGELFPGASVSAGGILSVQRSGPDELTFAAPAGTFVFSRSRLGDLTRLAQIAAPHSDAPFGNGRTIGGTPLAFSTGTGVVRVINRVPRISVVRFPGHVPRDVNSLVAAGEATVREYLTAALDQAFLQPVVFPEFPGEAPVQGTSPINPPDALVHHYVRVQASGALGSELRIAAESLAQGGNLNSPTGKDRPPVLLSDRAADLGYTGDAQAPVSGLRLRRLSDNPTNELYNEYLSSPFLIVRQKLNAQQLAALGAMPERVALWSSVFLRFGFDAPGPGQVDADLAPWLAQIKNARFLPGVSRTFLGMASEYIDSPNPSPPRLSPRLAGVDLQSGEFTAPEVDYHIEGRHQDILLQRVYQSRSQYTGPFGRGWDHNYNARIVLMPDALEPGTQLQLLDKGDSTVSASVGDVQLIDGAGSVLLFREISAAKNNLDRKPLYASDPALGEFYGLNAATDKVAVFYDSPVGIFSILVRLKDGRFVHIAPTGHRMVFYPDGRLDRLTGAFEASELVMEYRPDGLLDRVVGDRGLKLSFGYDFPFLNLRRVSNTDRVSEDAVKFARVARIECSDSIASALTVDYEYDTLGRLATVTPNLGKQTVLTWDPNQPDLLVRLGSTDGTGPPSVMVSYDNNGLATGVEMGGGGFAFGGATTTAAQRFSNPGAVTITPTNGQTVTVPVDRRGAPQSFGGRALVADDSTGLPMRFDSPEQRVEMEYDSASPVHRFRGNVTKTRRGEPGHQVVATTTYDGGAFNRPKITTAGDGVVTDRTYLDLGIGGLEVKETSGPVTRRTKYSEFGQLEFEEQMTNGALEFRTNFALGSQPADAQLLSTTNFDTIATTHRDEFGRAESFGKVNGLRFTLQYKDGTGLLEAQAPSTPIVPTTSYSYDDMLRLGTETVRGGANQITSTYSHTDARYPGRVTTFTQEETGLPESETNYGYNANAQIGTVTIDGATETYTYDGTRNTGVTGPGLSRSVEYDGTSHRMQKITENGIETNFSYDDEGRLQTLTSAGAINTFTYDTAPVGNVSERIVGKKITADDGTNATLLDESWHHDAAGRLDRVTSALSGRVREFSYFADGSLRTTKINDKVVREVGRDVSGRLTSTRLNQLQINFSDHDLATGIPRRETLTFDGSTGGTVTVQKTFDAVGRVLTQDVGETHYEFGWDSFGNLTSHKDSDSVIFGQTSAPSGLPLMATFTDGTTAQHSYDAHRRRNKILTDVGSINFLYDSAGLAKQITYPDGSISKFEQRNAFFEPTLVTHGDHIQNHSFDDAGRLVGIEEQNSGDSIALAYDALGRRTAATFNDVEIGFGYNPGGAANSETVTVADTNLGTWSQTLNVLDHVLSETYPTGGFTLNYQPDTFGQPASVSEAGIGSVTWKAASLPDEIRYAGGLIVRHEYDTGLRLTGVRYEGHASGNQPTLAGFRYELTSGGRVQNQQRLHAGGFDVFERNGPGEGMRITGVAFGATNKLGAGAVASLGGIGFASGEITTPAQQSNPTLAGADPRGFFPAILRPNGEQRPSRIGGTSITYDGSGAMTAFPVWVVLPGQSAYTQIDATAAYDGLGQISAITRADGVAIAYKRDGIGRVFEREITGPSALCRPGKTRYRWKADRLIEEHEQPAGAPTLALKRRYVWLDSRLVLVQAAPSPGASLVDFVPLVTINGSVGGFATPAGSLVEVIDYTAYGAPFVRSAGSLTPIGRSAISPTVLFQGAWFDDASGLYQFGSRTLHPFSGLFLQRDSALFSDSLAFFTAFNGDPAGRVDPTGAVSGQAGGTIAFLQEKRDLYNQAKEIREPLTGLVEAFGAGDPLEIAGSLAETSSKTIGLLTSTSDEDVQERYKLVTETLDQVKEGVDVLKAVNGIRKDRELLRAISVFTGAGGSTANVSLRNLARLGAGASPSDVGDSILDLSGSEEIRNTAIRVRNNPSAAARFYHEQRGEASERRREHLNSVSKGVHSLGKVLVSQYLAGDESASRLANQFIGTSEATFDLANSVTDVLGSKNLSRFRHSLNPLRPKRALASIRRFSNLAEGRSAVQAAFTAGFEVGKLGIVALCDDDVAKAYMDLPQQFADNGGFLTVAGGVLSTFGLDSAAQRIQQVADIRDAFTEDLNLGMQLLFDENRRGVVRREAYLNGISEP